MKPVTLVYCMKGNSVLLGMKKRGFGCGKLNGYGGKVHADEEIAGAAIRELSEEAGITAENTDLEKVAEIDFFFAGVPEEKGWNQTVHVFLLSRWTGEPKETDEMKPEWHSCSALPLDKMWVDDPHWLPDVLKGRKIRASFTFGNQGASILEHKVTPTESL